MCCSERPNALPADQTFHLSWWGFVGQHLPGVAVPRSMVGTCWCFSPWCLWHRHTSLRFFSPQLPPFPAHHAAFYLWMHSLTDHIERQSIFLLLWRSKGALFMCIPFLQLRSITVITAPRGVHPCSFTGVNTCSLCYYAPCSVWHRRRIVRVVYSTSGHY